MDRIEWINRLNEQAAKLKINGKNDAITISPEQAEKLHDYMQLLVSWNEKMNLTAIISPEEIITKHFLDCVSGLPYLPENGRWIDVGTGAGFPGMVLQIARPGQNAILMDALQKRLTFLEEVRTSLKLDHCQLLHERAEEAGAKKEFREMYAAAVARAVAPMPVLLEYCLPLVQTGGVFLAYKGPGLEEELEGCTHALKVLGAKVEQIVPVEIPSSGPDEEPLMHRIAVIRKIRPAQAAYPRKMAKIKKEPLG